MYYQEANKSVKHSSSSDKDKFSLDESRKQGALVKHELCDAEEVEAETHEYEVSYNNNLRGDKRGEVESSLNLTNK